MYNKRHMMQCPLLPYPYYRIGPTRRPIMSASTIKSLVTSFRQNRLLMYGLIGGVASAIDVGLFILLYEVMGMSALISHSISIPLSAAYSFLCNAYFNFSATDNMLARFASFSVVVALGYLLGAAIISVTVAYTAWGGTAGKFLSLPLVFVFQYFLNSRISFREYK